MKATTLVSAIVATCFVGGAAYAQTPAHTPQQILPNIFSTSPGGTLDVRGDYTNLDRGSLVGINAQFQYITPGNLGLYGSIPFGYASDGVFGNSISGIGNLELGGLYVIRNRDLDMYLRGGVALDTAGDEGSFAAPFSAILPRLADALPSGGNSSWLRAHGGLRNTNGSVRFGATAGVDIPIDDGNDSEDGLLVLAGSLGIVQPTFGVSGGLVYLQQIGRESGDNNTLGFNANVDFVAGRTAKLFIALGINLEDENDGFSIGFGARIGL